MSHCGLYGVDVHENANAARTAIGNRYFLRAKQRDAVHAQQARRLGRETPH